MVDFSKWAKRSQTAAPRRPLITSQAAPIVDPAGVPAAQRHQVARPVATMTPTSLVISMPAPTRPVELQQSRTYQHAQRQRNFIMKSDLTHGDLYAPVLDNAVDLMKASGQQPSGYDAMKMHGRIVDPQSEYRQWSPQVRHYVGVREVNSAGDFDGLKQERDMQLARAR